MSEIFNRINVNLNKFISDNAILLNEVIRETKYHPEFVSEDGIEHIKEVIDIHY
jgi:hypothetical protein